MTDLQYRSAATTDRGDTEPEHTDRHPDDLRIDELAFDGEAFNPFASTTTAVVAQPGTDRSGVPASGHAEAAAPPARQAPIRTPEAQPRGEAALRRTRGRLLRRDRGSAASSVSDLATGVIAAHRAALSAQLAVQRALWEHVRHDSQTRDGVGTDRSQFRLAGVEAVRPAPEGAFKPLRRPEFDRYAGVHVAQILSGSGYRGRPHLEALSDIHLRGGTHGLGSLTAQPRRGAPMSVVADEAAVVFAALVGLHLCVPAPRITVTGTRTAELPAGPVRIEVRDVDLIPRPYLVVDVHPADAAQPGPFASVTVRIVEGPGTSIGPGPGGAAPTPSARTGRDGTPALLNEFHMAQLSRGDQAEALGPEFAGYTGRRATRLPTGGLLLVDRVIRFSGQRGVLDTDPIEYDSEYDAPADSWYFADTANESMPHFVYMETSLQAALLMGYYTGPTLIDPSATASLRNLGGRATVLRQVDLRDTTISQHSRLLSTTILPGSSLQTFDYTLSVDGEPFYTGETLFGYFSDEALATQSGLDAGAHRHTWIAAQQKTPVTRRIDVASRRIGTDRLPHARGPLALLDWVDVVDDGGDHGLGYLHAVRKIDPGDWFFRRHFHLDPVIPGSLGVETVIQAVQEWMVDRGYGRDQVRPGFVIPEGIAFEWKYRGQFLPTDEYCEFEVHIKEVRAEDRSVVVVVDASLWKPGLRIYELTDLSVELRDAAR